MRKFGLWVLIAAGVVAFYFALVPILAAGLSYLLGVFGFGADRVEFYGQTLAQGARITLELTVISALAGLALGLLFGIGRTSSRPYFRWPSDLYVWLIRGTPLLVQLLFVYSALPFILGPIWRPLENLGLPPVQDLLTPYWAAFVALSINVGAYNAEVIRAGIQAVPRGQWEAARIIGLSPGATMRHVIIPQALRVTIPPLVNNVVALLKDSSLASAITLLELTLAGQRIVSATFRPVEVYASIALVYLFLTTILTLAAGWLERRVNAAG
jgi:polar amino acid transport system permease protein